MCGIAGILLKRDFQNSEEIFDSFLNASETLYHRGPDNRGVTRLGNLLLVHYRLSILDLDERSNQPYTSASQTNVMVYNGEVYNFKELATKYGIVQRTASDTEVILETFERSGIDAVEHWNGIFAAAIVNKDQNKLYLIRDRFGIKPLYIYEDDNFLAFSSESKLFYKWLDSFSINLQGLSEFLWFGNTLSEQTFVNNVKKIIGGNILSINLHTFSKKTDVFWSLKKDQSFPKISQNEAIVGIRERLRSAVERQLISDVPIGVLLSGGVDSSAITAFASQCVSKIDTYSIDYDFNLGGESELPRARMVAKKFGTNHHELKVDTKNIVNIFQDLVYQYDEPFSDQACIPLYLLSKAAKTDKTVILQGDGGDELFAGYRRYNILKYQSLWKFGSSIFAYLPSGNPLKLRFERIKNIFNQETDDMKMALFMTQDVLGASPFNILSHNYKNALLKSTSPFLAYQQSNSKFDGLSLLQKMQNTDIEILLQHTFLEKVDKATMLCSVEARVPFLDNDLATFALNIRTRQKISFGDKKYLLKQALKGIVPDEVLNGKKRGFDVPYKHWLKNDLYSFAVDTFNNLPLDGVMDKTQLIKLLNLHKNGVGNYGPILWKSLVLSHWLQIYGKKIQNGS